MSSNARASGMPSSSAGKEVGDIVQTPDAPIKSWRYLGGGKWEPNDVVRFTETSPGGGNRFLVGGQELIQVAVVRQGIGSDLPSRPDAEIVHWYASDRVAPDPDHPHDQVFPAGPLLLFARDQQGASHDAGNPSAVSNASGVGVLGGAISVMLDQSPRINDAAGSGAARPTYYGRTNLLLTSENLDGWDKTALGAGVLPAILPAAGVAPDGSNTAIHVTLDCGDTASSANRSYIRASHTSVQGTEYRARIWLKAATPSDVGKTIRAIHENSNASGLLHVLTADWVMLERSPVRGATGTLTNWLLECRGTFTQQSASFLMWHPDLRYLGADAGVAPYQPITAAADYVTQGFPVGALFDGVDDAMTVAAGGGGTTGFFWCGAIRLEKIGAEQTLFSDTGANTGYRVRISASNQLEFSAGNGSAYTSIATARALKVGERAVCTAWHDGANLYAQLDDGDIASTAFATATAGTAGYTIGKDNGAASGYFGGVLYAYCYLRNTSPSAPWRDLVQLYAAGKAKLPMGA